MQSLTQALSLILSLIIVTSVCKNSWLRQLTQVLINLVVIARFVVTSSIIVWNSQDCSIVFHHIQSLALLILTVTFTAIIILFIITDVTLWGAQFLICGFHEGCSDIKLDISQSAMIMVMLLFIYDTIIVTLTLTFMVLLSNLKCHLKGQWTWLLFNKNVKVIHRIQDCHQCCEFNFMQNRAWSFSNRSHTAVACHKAFERE